MKTIELGKTAWQTKKPNSTGEQGFSSWNQNFAEEIVISNQIMITLITASQAIICNDMTACAICMMMRSLNCLLQIDTTSHNSQIKMIWQFSTNLQPISPNQWLNCWCIISVIIVVKALCEKFSATKSWAVVHMIFVVNEASWGLQTFSFSFTLHVVNKYWMNEHRWENWINTLGPKQIDRYFADDTFKHIFVNENVSVSINV